METRFTEEIREQPLALKRLVEWYQKSDSLNLVRKVSEEFRSASRVRGNTTQGAGPATGTGNQSLTSTNQIRRQRLPQPIKNASQLLPCSPGDSHRPNRQWCPQRLNESHQVCT